MTDETKVCAWCGNRLVNVHWHCRTEAALGADLETRYGYARNRWGAQSKHYDFEWYGEQDDDHEFRV